MTNDIVPVRTQIIQTMDDAERAARAMSASGFFLDTKQAAQAVVKILAGSELGFGPFASMTGVNIIQNKPVLAANLMAAAVKRTGKYNYRVVEMSDTVCELAFFEEGKEVGRSRFTMQEAANAGLSGKDNWKKYPRNMLFARAVSNGQKWYAPDIFNGATVYTPDELGAIVDEEGNAVGLPVVEPMIIESAAPSPMKQTLPIWTDDKKQHLIDAKLAGNGFAANAMLGLSNLPLDATKEQIVAWGKLYRKYRPDPKAKDANTSVEAANLANAEFTK